MPLELYVVTRGGGGGEGKGEFVVGQSRSFVDIKETAVSPAGESPRKL